MTVKPCFGRLCYLLVTCLAFVTLSGMVRSSIALCDEIHEAADAGDVARVGALLKSNPGLVFSKDKDGATPLHKAAGLGYKDVVELLLANKANVNAADNNGDTPLHDAALVQLLSATLDAGMAEVKSMFPSKDDKPAASLFSSSLERQKSVVQLLLANKADVNARNKLGATPLHQAVALGCKDMVALLLANKADVNAKAVDGITPLHIAAELPLKDIAELLLANKADVNAKDNEGKTPLQHALSKGQKDIAELLRRHGGK